MAKLVGGGAFAAAMLGLLLLILNHASTTLGGDGDTVRNEASNIVRQLPGATIDNLKKTTDAISGNPTTNSIASQSDTYQGAKTTVDATSTGKSLLETLWAIIKLLAKVTLLIGVIALITRGIYRRRRTYVTYEIRAHRESIVSTEQIRTFMSATCNLIYVRSRRLQRLFTGSPSFAFRVLSSPNKTRGDSEIASYITIPGDEILNTQIRDKFADTYQDAELIKVKNTSWPKWGFEIVRNKKTRMIPFTIRVPGISTASESFEEGFNAPVMDKVVTAMAAAPIPAEVQFVSTPVPRPMNWLIRKMARASSQSSQRADAIERRENENVAQASANEGHLFVEMRVGSPNYEFSRDVAAVLQGAAGGDAQLRERRPVLRKALYQDRFYKAVGNPLPSWLYSVYSTSELSSLWQLPSASLRSITTKRHNRRRVSVPPEVHYIDSRALPEGHDAEAEDLAMWLSPERKEIALLPDDFLYGVGVAGQQGMGKTVLMGRMVASLLSQDRGFSGLICDPKGDLAEAALAYLPPDRKVHYIDFDDPQIGINPFEITNMDDEAAIVNVILHGIIDVARTEEDESQIMASSKDFLTMALYATLATTIPFGYKPTFYHLRKWISSDPGNVEWRKGMLEAVIRKRRSRLWIYEGYLEYHSSLARSEAAFTQRAAAPMNKIAELLTESIDRILRHEQAINFEEAIRNNEIIIVNGRNHKSADMIFRFLWQMADQTLGRLETARNKALRDRELGEEVEVPDKVKFLFAVDEAPSIMTPTTAEIMARRRSAGLHMMIGWQHDAQIRNPMVRSAIYSLLQNVFQFRTSVEDARQRIDLFQMSYDDQLVSCLRDILTNRVSVADITNLDRYNVYIFQLVEGNRVPAYWGWTIDPAGRASYAAEHLMQQRQGGGHSMGPLSPPDFELQELETKKIMSKPKSEQPRFKDPADNLEERLPNPGIDSKVLAVNDPIAEEQPASPEVQKANEKPPAAAGTEQSSSRAVESRDATEAPEKPQENNGSQNGNGQVRRKGKQPTIPPDPAALEDELSRDKTEILSDMSNVTDQMAGPGNDKARGSLDDEGGHVGPLGQHLPGEIGSWLEAVDGFRDIRGEANLEFIEPPSDAIPGSVQARNEKASQLASDSKVIPPNTQAVLHWLYEFNVMSQTQIVFATGLSKATVARRMNAFLDKGIVRGMALGRQKIWTLTDLGVRVGRRINNRRGPLIPHEPGKSPDGKNEADRKWGPRNVDSAHSIIHDMHVASYVLRFIELLDGDFRYVRNPSDGLVLKMTGEFGALVEPPVKKTRRGTQKLGLFDLSSIIPGIAFEGIDLTDGTLRRISPDAALQLHNLTDDPDTARRELWIELDRQGHATRLTEKLQNYDVFMALWWRTIRRFQKAGRPPVVIFVAPTISILKRQLLIADTVLVAQSGRAIEGSENWGPPPARNRIFFALESDLHKGSTRVYRVPELTPAMRLAAATTPQERTAAINCQPRLDEHLLPLRLMAGRRVGTHAPPDKREG